MSRFARKVDANHNLIANALRLHGYWVLSLAPMGNGVPDLLCVKGPFACFVEVKGLEGKRKPRAAKRNRAQLAFADRAALPTFVLASVEEVKLFAERVRVDVVRVE